MDKLNKLGDGAMGSATHHDAVAHFSSILALDSLSVDVLIKRSKAYSTIGDWEAALKDANTVCVIFYLTTSQ